MRRKRLPAGRTPGSPRSDHRRAYKSHPGIYPSPHPQRLPGDATMRAGDEKKRADASTAHSSRRFVNSLRWTVIKVENIRWLAPHHGRLFRRPTGKFPPAGQSRARCAEVKPALAVELTADVPCVIGIENSLRRKRVIPRRFPYVAQARSRSWWDATVRPLQPIHATLSSCARAWRSPGHRPPFHSSLALSLANTASSE